MRQDRMHLSCNTVRKQSKKNNQLPAGPARGSLRQSAPGIDRSYVSGNPLFFVDVRILRVSVRESKKIYLIELSLV